MEHFGTKEDWANVCRSERIPANAKHPVVQCLVQVEQGGAPGTGIASGPISLLPGAAENDNSELQKSGLVNVPENLCDPAWDYRRVQDHTDPQMVRTQIR